MDNGTLKNLVEDLKVISSRLKKIKSKLEEDAKNGKKKREARRRQ